ncbi:MAG: hypothetical protein ACI4P6_07480 [Candidatus Spyradosoma sp.]
MKSVLLPTALLAAAMTVPAIAATPTSGEAQNLPPAKTEMSVAALQKMQQTIEADEPVIDELELSAWTLEDLPPDEQFRDIAAAINRKFPEGEGRRDAIARVFGEDYVDTMAGTLDSPEKTESVEKLLGEAHKLFLSYENRNDVSDWGWGEAWGVTIAPNIGTLGLGIQVGYEFNKYFKVRAHYGSGKISHTGTFEDAPYHASFKNNNNVGVFFDWHPRGSQFHVTAGLIRMDPRVKITAKYRAESSGATYGLVRTKDYLVLSDFEMSGDWDNDVMPYLGFGWSTDGGQARTLFFTIDIGVAYLGEGNYNKNPQVLGRNPMLLERPDANSPWTLSHDFDTASTLLELDKNIRDGLDKIATFLNDMYVYPVIQFGGGIRF